MGSSHPSSRQNKYLVAGFQKGRGRKSRSDRRRFDRRSPWGTGQTNAWRVHQSQDYHTGRYGCGDCYSRRSIPQGTGVDEDIKVYRALHINGCLEADTDSAFEECR